jgi:hypothetical protein
MKLKELKEIVQAMIDGGGFKAHGRLMLDNYRVYADEVFFFLVKGGSVTYTLADLLASPEAMRVFGEDEVCRTCGAKKPDRLGIGYSHVENGRKVHKTCHQPNGKLYVDQLYIPAWKHHAHKALDIIWDEGEQAAIEYLYGQLKGGSDE